MKHKEKDKLKQNETPKIEQPRNTTRKNLVEKKLKFTINFYFQTELLKSYKVIQFRMLFQ